MDTNVIGDLTFDTEVKIVLVLSNAHLLNF